MTDDELDEILRAANPAGGAQLAALDLGGTGEEMVEAIMEQKHERNYARLGSVAAAIAVVIGLAVGFAVIDGGKEERGVLKLVLSSTNRSGAKLSADAAMAGVGEADVMPSMIYWQPTEYSFADDFSLPSGSSTVWVMDSSKADRDEMRSQAASAIEQLGGTPDENHIWSDDYAPYYWSYSDYTFVAAEESASGGDASDSSGGGSSGSSGGQTEPMPPDVIVDCSLYPKDPACFVEVPTPPENVPSKDEAESLAREFFDALGLNLDNYEIESWADEWGASVSAYLLVEDHNTWMGWNIGFGANSAVTYASGVLSKPVSLGEYPLADQATVIERLDEYQQIMPMMKDGLEYATSTSSTGAVTEDVITSSTVSPDTTDPGLTPEPVPTTPIEPPVVIPPVDTIVPPEPRKVELVRAELGLTQFYDVEGRLLLVPAFDLYSSEGLEVTILAVAKEFVDENTPDDVVLPGVDEPSRPIETVVPPTDSTDVPPEWNPIPQDEADALVGMSEEEAIKAAESKGWTVRVAARDDEYYNLTADYIPNRVNLYIQSGDVASVKVG